MAFIYYLLLVITHEVCFFIHSHPYRIIFYDMLLGIQAHHNSHKDLMSDL